MARLPNPGQDADSWGSILNEYLQVEHNADGTQKTLSLNKGGTGATNAQDARRNMGIHSNVPIYIQYARPSSPGPHLWIQTGIGPGGNDMTFWIDDGR